MSPLTVPSAPSRHSASIAFSGSKGIVVVAGRRRRLLGKGSGPVFSADGARLVFTAGTAVWQMNADGTCRTRAGSGGEPAWKPVPVGRIRC